MPLETGTYIADLVTSNPVSTDGLSQGDDHLRLIKSVLKATFPNWTSAAINSSQAQLDAAVALLGGVGVLPFALGSAAAPTITPLGDADTGIYSPGANQLALAVGGAQAVAINADKSVALAGAASVAGALAVTGNTTVGGVLNVTGEAFAASLGFVGEVRMWAGAGDPNTYWLVCDGRAVSRTTYAVLYSIVGTTYGVGDGVTTFNLPNTAERVIVGKSGSKTLITQYDATVLGGTFGEGTHALTTAELATHSHGITDPGHTHVIGLLQGAPNGGSFSAYTNSVSSNATASSTTGITVNNQGSGTAHNNVQPALVLNHIIKVL